MNDRIIQAVIVHHERKQVLVDSKGNLPELAFSAEHRTTEDTLSHLGRIVLDNVAYVSVDYGFSHDGKTVYQTKPVPEAAQPIAPYQWGAAPIELR